MSRPVLYTIDGMGGGGAERSLRELLPGAQDAGWRPTIACLHRRSEGVQDQLLAEGADLRFLPGPMPAKLRALRRLLDEVEPALVHSTLFQATMLTRVALVGRPTPLLTSLVNMPYDRARVEGDPGVRTGLVRWIRLVDRMTSSRTTGFHAITHAVRDAAVRDLGIPPERIEVVHRGRDPERLGTPSAERRRRVRDALDIPSGARVVVNVGRAEYQKGQRDLLVAASSMLGDARDVHVLIAGRRGAASTSLDRMHTDLRLGDRVRFLGYRHDVPDLLAASDVFAFPSLYEGLGGSLIEAMALGLPIVASDIPAVREVVAPSANADLVPPGDPAALATALGSLLDDSDRAARYSAESRRRFETSFTLAASTDRMLGLYDAVVDAQEANRG